MLSVDDAHRLISKHLGGDPARAVHSAVVALLMRQLARRTGADLTLWEVTGLCHDLDFAEVAGDWSRHGLLAAEWLRDDLPDDALDAIRAHDHRTGFTSNSPIAVALKLCDSLAIARERLGPPLHALLADGSGEALASALAPRKYLATMIEANAATLGIALAALAEMVRGHATVLGSVTPRSPGFVPLRAQAAAQGHRMLQHFEENWTNGSNRFDQPGEVVFGAFDVAALVGLCGRNRDPYDRYPRAGRVRHLYVAVGRRQSGLGRMLVEEVIRDAGSWFDYLNTNCPPDSAGFYERLGFVPVDAPRVTHRLALKH